MCYNVRIEMTRDEIADFFRLDSLQAASALPERDGPEKRMTLGQMLPAATTSAGAVGLEMLYWGFTPSWMKDPKGGMKPGNARAETVATTPMFRQAFSQRRCVVPANGFYEWMGVKGSKQLLPFTAADLAVFGLPGIWDEWRMPDGGVRRSCAIVTCDPNGDIRPYHDRMPVILDQDEARAWLSDASPKDLQSLLRPFPEGALQAFPGQAFKP
ncbi:SOS response-associated peptidase [Capsulimonas corticalis]|nr:SOS response-associated peptidase [Capsulimonas corticalis]